MMMKVARLRGDGGGHKPFAKTIPENIPSCFLILNFWQGARAVSADATRHDVNTSFPTVPSAP